jgi:hypothetical protein
MAAVVVEEQRERVLAEASASGSSSPSSPSGKRQAENFAKIS